MLQPLDSSSSRKRTKKKTTLTVGVRITDELGKKLLITSASDTTGLRDLFESFINIINGCYGLSDDTIVAVFF